MEYIKGNLEEIKDRIRRTCERCGRKPEEITLVAVSKTVDLPQIEYSLTLGIGHLGENKPQEIVRKQPLIHGQAQWHMIGNLQSNKVRHIVDKVAMIQSVDSFKLAQEISKRATALNRSVPILLQVNIGSEEQKGGIEIGALKETLVEISKLPGLHIQGLMCIAPFLEDVEAVRPYFKKMKSLFDEIRKMEYNSVDMLHLSMGMTHDFEVAIEEGATIIRVGTGIYGARNY